jgi:hypothetical protein
MKLSRPFLMLVAIGTLATFFACSNDEGTPPRKPGTGGTAGGAGKGSAGTGGTLSGGAGTAGTTNGGTSGTGGSTAGSAGAPMAGSSGTAGVAGNAGTSGSSGSSGSAGSAGSGVAGEDSGGQGGEGGVPGCEANPGTIYMGDASFDSPGSSAGWNFAAEPENLGGLGDGFARRVTDEGHLCPGALEVTLPFSVYGENERAGIEKAAAVNWTGKTSLHVWIRVADPGGGSIAFINGIQVFVRSMGDTVSSSKFVGAAAFDDFQWHEIVMDLTATPAVVLTDVSRVGVQVIAATTRPPSAPLAPKTTVVYVDDLYLE